MIGAFSRDSERCRKCIYYKDCDEKQMEMCAYIIPDKAIEEIIDEVAMQCVMPNSLLIGDIQKSVDWQALRMQTSQELADMLYSETRRMCNGKMQM